MSLPPTPINVPASWSLCLPVSTQRRYHQFVGALLLVGFVGAYFWWILAALAAVVEEEEG